MYFIFVIRLIMSVPFVLCHVVGALPVRGLDIVACVLVVKFAVSFSLCLLFARSMFVHHHLSLSLSVSVSVCLSLSLSLCVCVWYM